MTAHPSDLPTDHWLSLPRALLLVAGVALAAGTAFIWIGLGEKQVECTETPLVGAACVSVMTPAGALLVQTGEFSLLGGSGLVILAAVIHLRRRPFSMP